MAELNSDNDDDFDHLVTHVVMYDKMLQTALLIANFTETQIQRGSEAINISSEVWVEPVFLNARVSPWRCAIPPDRTKLFKILKN
jgi:hypothetical protein